jgi:cell division protein FtsB
MSTSHTTSSIPRVARTRRVARSGADHTRFGTRVIDDEHQLVSRRPHRWLLAGLGLAVVMALGAALFVLPVQAWMRQRDDLVRKSQELDVLSEANRQLGAEVDHLQTPQGAREAARDELGVVGPGEERVSMLPTAGPLPLPTGWPYDTITQIVAVRQAVTP